MSYKYSKGEQVIGDLKAADDIQRDTLIDFEEDAIYLKTGNTERFRISGSNGAITFNGAFTFPVTDGQSNQVLQTNGSGQLSFANASGGGGVSGLEYAYGHVDLTTNGKPTNWINASSVSSANGIKTWFIVPKATTLDKVIVSVKSNNFNTANDGNITLDVYKNQTNFGSTIVNQTVAAGDFTEKVSNMAGGTTDCNQKTFSNLNQSLAEGDLIQIKVTKSTGSDKEALVTMIFNSSGGVSSTLTVTSPKTTNYTASNNEVIPVNLVGASNDVTITLPTASPDAQVIIKIDGAANGKIVTVDGNGSEQIDGSTTRTMDSDYESMHLISNGTGWLRIS